MPLSEFLSADRIVVLADAGGREGVIDAAAKLLAGGAAGSDTVAAIADSLRQRERMGSTAIGHGVAIPHGRNAAFGATRAAFLRLVPAVDFNAADGEPVDLVFAMAVPADFNQQHLQLLSDIAERCADPAFRAALRDATDVQALRGILLGTHAPTGDGIRGIASHG
jgi:PTS system nitrogen regulatory IIA component